MILLAAGNLEQAVRHAQSEGLKRADWQYVHSIRDLRGVRHPMLIIGTFWRRQDAMEIYRSAKARGMCE